MFFDGSSQKKRLNTFWVVEYSMIDRVALCCILLFGTVLFWFYDVNIHGADQIRDLDVARRFLNHHVWPINSPPMFGEQVRLPPAFYYILALPLRLRDRDETVFVLFALLYVCSVLYLWREIASKFGSLSGLAYVAFAFPVFASMQTHSAWNPALVMPLSNLWLALFIRAIESRQEVWATLPWVAFLLIQIHPSAAPLLLGLFTYGLMHRRVVFTKSTTLSLAVIVVFVIFWALYTGIALRPFAKIGAADLGGAHYSLLGGILDWKKWCDALLMPYGIVKGIQPEIGILPALISIQLGAMYFGLVFGAPALYNSNTYRWIFVSVVLWFFAAMVLLKQGSFWHLDVMQPWLAVLAALGMVDIKRRVHLSDRAFKLIIIAIIFLVLVAHILLYSSFSKKGSYDIGLSRVFFPNSEALSQYKVPAYTYKHLRDVRSALISHGICGSQVAGMRAMLMQDMTLRAFEPHCTQNSLKRGYFFAQKYDSDNFDFTKGLIPLQNLSGEVLYAVDPVSIGADGSEVIRARTDLPLNYMTYAPAYLERGWGFSILPSPHDVIVRIALRCLKEYPVQESGNWVFKSSNMKGVLTAASIKSQHHRYLGFNYYDIEWMVPSTPLGIDVSFDRSSLECDVSAIARAR